MSRGLSTDKGEDMETKEMIRKAISETTWSGAEQYVKALKRGGFQFWSQLPELFRGFEEIERAAHQ